MSQVTSNTSLNVSEKSEESGSQFMSEVEIFCPRELSESQQVASYRTSKEYEQNIETLELGFKNFKAMNAQQEENFHNLLQDWKELKCRFGVTVKNAIHLDQDIKTVVSDLDDLRFQTVSQRVENENLKVAVCDLEHQLEKDQQDHTEKDELLQKLVRFEHLTEKLQTENKTLLATVQDLQEMQNSLSDQNKTMNAELVLLESQIEKKEEENENLLAEIHALQVNEKILNEKNQRLTADVDHHKQQRERDQEEIHRLTAAVLDLQREVKEVHWEKHELKQQLTEMETKEAEIKKLRAALHDLQEKDKFLKAEPEQLQTPAAEPQQVESPAEPQQLQTPAAEPQTLEMQTSSAQPLWRRCVKRLERVGWKAGIVTACIVVPAVTIGLIANCRLQIPLPH